MADNTQTVFRKKTLDRIASPEQLTDYLRVTNPGIWVILVAVILLLAGVFAWSSGDAGDKGGGQGRRIGSYGAGNSAWPGDACGGNAALCRRTGLSHCLYRRG